MNAPALSVVQDADETPQRYVHVAPAAVNRLTDVKALVARASIGLMGAVTPAAREKAERDVAEALRLLKLVQGLLK